MITTLVVLQHVDREGPGVIAELAQERGLGLEIVRPDQGDPLPDPARGEHCMALVLGGPMSVSDIGSPGMDWLRTELNWLATWHQRRRPVLGICLGAQLLAVAAGGHVEPLQVGSPPTGLKEVGVGAIHWWASADETPLLRGLAPSENVLHWHGDRIRLPAGATLLASSLHCREQVFRIDDHAIGLQCHLELNQVGLERWIAEDHAYVVSARGPQGPDELREQWRRLGAGIERQGRRLFLNVLDQWTSPTVTIATKP